jgi:hypothetical protein
LKPFLKNNYKEIFKDCSLFDQFQMKFIDEIKNGFFTADEEEKIMESLDDNKEGLKSYYN